jgi:hypothetical protein
MSSYEVINELITIRQDDKYEDIRPVIRKAIRTIEDGNNRMRDISVLLRSVNNLLKD